MHCGKQFHGAGLRTHVASVHPEEYRKSRSVRAHRSPKPRRKASERSGKAARHESSPGRGVVTPSAPVVKHSPSKSPRTRAESPKENTDRIWNEVRARMHSGHKGTPAKRP